MLPGIEEITDFWLELESDPGLFTLLLEDYGVTDVEVEEIMDINQSFKENIYGFIFLFRYKEVKRPKKKIKKVISKPELYLEDEKIVDNMFFAEQIVPNSCATHALLSVILNQSEINLGPVLDRFKSHTLGMNPENKGLSIGNIPELAYSHNLHASFESLKIRSKLGKECSKSSRMNVVVFEAFHYVSFVPINGRLFELDGLKKFPIDHGTWRETEVWSDLFKKVISERLGISTDSSSSNNDLFFNLMAVVPSERLLLEKRIELLKSNRELIISSLENMITISKDANIENLSLGSSNNANTPIVSQDMNSASNCQDNIEDYSWLITINSTILENIHLAPKELLTNLKNLQNEIIQCEKSFLDTIEKIENIKIDSSRRSHNYDPFIKTFLSMLAKQGHLAELLTENLIFHDARRKIVLPLQMKTINGDIDIESLSSILRKVDLKDILIKESFSLLSQLDQNKLIILLPVPDSKSTDINSALKNEFIVKAFDVWKEKLLSGFFNPENIMSPVEENYWIEREKAKLDPWKLKNFEPVWGQKFISSNENATIASTSPPLIETFTIPNKKCANDLKSFTVQQKNVKSVIDQSLRKKKKQSRIKIINVPNSVDECFICQNIGELLMCDACPRVYNLQCLQPALDHEPEDDIWICHICRSNELDVILRGLLERGQNSSKEISNWMSDNATNFDFNRRNLRSSISTGPFIFTGGSKRNQTTKECTMADPFEVLKCKENIKSLDASIFHNVGGKTFKMKQAIISIPRVAYEAFNTVKLCARGQVQAESDNERDSTSLLKERIKSLELELYNLRNSSVDEPLRKKFKRINKDTSFIQASSSSTTTNNYNTPQIQIRKLAENYDKTEKERLILRQINNLIHPMPKHFWPIVEKYSLSHFFLLMCRGQTINLWLTPEEPIEIIHSLGNYLISNIDSSDKFQILMDKDLSGDYHKVWYNDILNNTTVFDNARRRNLSRILRNAFDIDRRLYDFKIKGEEIKKRKKIEIKSKSKNDSNRKYERNVIKNKANDIQRLGIALHGLFNGFSNSLKKKNPIPTQEIGQNITLFDKYCSDFDFDKTKKLRIPEIIDTKESLLQTFQKHLKLSNANKSRQLEIDSEWNISVKFIKDHWDFIFFLNEDKEDATQQEIKDICEIMKIAEQNYNDIIRDSSLTNE